MDYFLIQTKCGHLGKQNYIAITFPLIASSAKEAARIARKKGRVKHNHKDAILKVEKVSYGEYFKQKLINEYDPYLCVKSRHEQNKIMPLIAHRILKDNHQDEIELKKKYKRGRRVNLKFQNLKNSSFNQYFIND